MGKTQKERALDYLWSIAPEAATNGEIRDAISAKSHQAVYMLTQELMQRELIYGEQRGRDWHFWVDESLDAQLSSPGIAHPESGTDHGEFTARDFENLARSAMGAHFGVTLSEGQVTDVHKRFDMVSQDERIIGDAKYYTRVRGAHLPPAKFSIIAEHVWLLEKTDAMKKFLVFGNDREVSLMWLERYGNLVTDVDFYFLTNDGVLEHLFDPDGKE